MTLPMFEPEKALRGTKRAQPGTSSLVRIWEPPLRGEPVPAPPPPYCGCGCPKVQCASCSEWYCGAPGHQAHVCGRPPTVGAQPGEGRHLAAVVKVLREDGDLPRPMVASRLDAALAAADAAR